MTETDADIKILETSADAFEELPYTAQGIDGKLLQQILEGILLASGRPMTVAALSELFLESEKPGNDQIRDALAAIADDCERRGYELREVASGFRFQVRLHLSPWISRLSDEKPQRYTRALLETLGLIAYRQPITRGDIEEIRGVAVSSTIIRTLLDREWIRVVGHRDVPGRPAMFATTRQFLDYFNIRNLQELPPLAEIRDLDQLYPELDLGDGTEGRVLALPEETEGTGAEVDRPELAELLDEDEAIALAKRPLDDILGYGRERNSKTDEPAEQPDRTSDVHIDGSASDSVAGSTKETEND